MEVEFTRRIGGDARVDGLNLVSKSAGVEIDRACDGHDTSFSAPPLRRAAIRDTFLALRQLLQLKVIDGHRERPRMYSLAGRVSRVTTCLERHASGVRRSAPAP